MISRYKVVDTIAFVCAIVAIIGAIRMLCALNMFGIVAGIAGLGVFALGFALGYLSGAIGRRHGHGDTQNI